jgi:hypothetical protein
VIETHEQAGELKEPLLDEHVRYFF